MDNPTTPACARCRGRGWHFAEAGPDEWPFEVPCGLCADQGLSLIHI